MTSDEIFLVLRAQLGDRDAMESLLKATAPWLHAYLLRALGQSSDADDAAQDVLILIARQLKHLRDARAYRAWVYRTASRRANRLFRQRAKERNLASKHAAAFDRAPAEDPPVLREETRNQLLAAISELPPNSKLACILHYCDGLTISQIAAILEIPEGTVKSRIAYALTHIRSTILERG